MKELSQQGSGQDTLRQVYAPTNDADEETKDSFYDKLQSVIHLTPRHDITIVAGDLNAKVGTKLDGEDGIVGEHGLQSERNDTGECFSSLCANKLTIQQSLSLFLPVLLEGEKGLEI